jgi:DNA-binding NtrC family response regulator
MSQVLIIESDEDTRYLYQMALRFQSFESTATSTAKEGLESIRKSVPDLVLLDIQVPDLDESHFIENLKKITSKNMPVIIVTDLRDGAAAKKAAVYGACEYLDKNRSIGEIISEVRKVIQK